MKERDARDLVMCLRKLKRSADLHMETSIILEETPRRCVKINTQSGRLMSPRLVVDTRTGRLVLTKERVKKLREGSILGDGWSRLLAEGCIEYLDVEEQDQYHIAWFGLDVVLATPGYYTHCEIHPSMIYGLLSNTMPFPNTNPAPRATYQAAMQKQSMAYPAANLNHRFDNQTHYLWYAQKPLVETHLSAVLNLGSENPAGFNPIVAVIPMGSNGEDAVIMSQSAADFGMGRSTLVRTFRLEERKPRKPPTKEYREHFECPEEGEVWVNMRRGSYAKIDEDGLVAPGMRVVGDDVLIAKSAPFTDEADGQYQDDTQQTLATIAGQRITSQRTDQEPARGKGEEEEIVLDDEVKPKQKKRCHSLANKSTFTGIVDSVMITESVDGFKSAKVKIRDTRLPMTGNKFSRFRLSIPAVSLI